MKWGIVYRQNNDGILYCVAKFLVWNDAKKYVEKQNRTEPGKYFMQLETVAL